MYPGRQQSVVSPYPGSCRRQRPRHHSPLSEPPGDRGRQGHWLPSRSCGRSGGGRGGGNGDDGHDSGEDGDDDDDVFCWMLNIPST